MVTLLDPVHDALRFGDATAVWSRSEQVTHVDLERRVSEAAGGLVEAGLHAGDRVLVVMSNCVESVVACHAAKRVGAMVIAVPASAGHVDVTYALETTAPRMSIAPQSHIADLRAGVPSAHWTALPSGGRRDHAPIDPSSPALVLFTSGTTARPKGVVHCVNSLAVAAANFAGAVALTADDAIFLVSPLASITGVLQALYMAPMTGATVVLEDHFEAESSLDLLVRTGATFYGGPDVVIARWFAAARSNGVAHLPLRAVSVGGTMLDQALLAEAEHDFGIRVTRAYGSSEAPFSAVTPLDAPVETRLHSDGRALDGVELRLGSTSDPNELMVRGPHMMLGYLAGEDNEAAFERDWFCTGDVAELSDDSGLRIVGRIKDIAIRNGIKVSLAEVEQAVRSIDGIESCVAYRVSDDATGEHVGVAVVADHAVRLAMVVDALLAGGLAKAKLPEELVEWSGPLPETATGKVRRDEVARRAARQGVQVASRLAQ